MQRLIGDCLHQGKKIIDSETSKSKEDKGEEKGRCSELKIDLKAGWGGE